MTKLLAAVAIGLALIAPGARAQEAFPSKTVRMILPYGAGSATDISGRILAEALKNKWGQAVVVDNKPGAFGILAIEEMARSKPDGHTIMLGNVSTNAITPVIYKSKMKIDFEKEVSVVTKISDIYSFFIVTLRDDFPPKTLKEFVAYAKANTGKLRFATPGAASYPHYDQEVLMLKEGFEATPVAAKSGGPGMLQDLMTGDVHYGFVNAASAQGVLKGGKLRALAINGPKRHPAFPDVPTMAEAGYPDVGSSNWQSILVPSATPQDIQEKIRAAFFEAINSPAVKDAFDKQQVHADPSPTLQAAKAFHDAEVARWTKIAAASRIKPE